MKAQAFLILPCLFVLLSSCTHLAAQKGKSDALEEISKGNLVLEAYGIKRITRPSENEVLLEEHGIEIRYVAGCVVDNKIINHAKGFNKVMKKAIQEQHENLSLDHY